MPPARALPPSPPVSHRAGRVNALVACQSAGTLQPQQQASVTFTVQDRDLSIWDVTAGAFVPQTGQFGVFVGSSSENIHLSGVLNN